MRVVQISAGVIAAVSLSVLPAYAQRGSSGSHGPSAPTAHITSHGPSSRPTPSSTTHANPGSAHRPSANGAAMTSGKSPKSSTTKTTNVKNRTGSTSKTSTSTTAGTTTTKADFAATPVGLKLTKNTALSSKITARLTAEGYTGSIYQAAYGFKNLGQFVAATNVSRNLGISFVQLKLEMTGIKVLADGTVLREMVGPDGKITLVDPSKTTSSTLTPAPTKSLGQSIQTLKSGVDATAAAQTATQQADAEIGGKK